VKLTIQKIWEQTIEVRRQKHASNVAKYDNVRVNTWRVSNPKWEWRPTMCILVQKEILEYKNVLKNLIHGLMAKEWSIMINQDIIGMPSHWLELCTKP
jgi:hypothetical protein